MVLSSSVALLGCGGNKSKTTAAPTKAPTKSPTPAPPVEYGKCEHILQGTPIDDKADIPTKEAYDAALKDLNFTTLQEDMATLLETSNDCWPADYGNYGPFMVRLAWHCSGTYRSDGKGGCAGGRQRFEPERSWPDNTNLDKARALLWPLKEKYGDALSWGDLLVLSGTVALKTSGAQITRMCFGRVDEPDGNKSKELDIPCQEQGKCKEPYGATTVGLIYVNPEGPMGDPNPTGSVAEIRRTFQTMGHSDEATVALIGGGHTIGKAHGACNKPAGLSPKEAFKAGQPIWKGGCDTGVGDHAVTSGFEGAWTTNPLQWDNEFFQLTLNQTWEKHTGPGGHWQWKSKDTSVMRLTTDIALLEDTEYKAIIEKFATDMSAFNQAFDDAWFKLTTTNVGGDWSANAFCSDGTDPRKSNLVTGTSYMRGDDAETMI